MKCSHTLHWPRLPRVDTSWKRTDCAYLLPWPMVSKQADRRFLANLWLVNYFDMHCTYAIYTSCSDGIQDDRHPGKWMAAYSTICVTDQSKVRLGYLASFLRLWSLFYLHMYGTTVRSIRDNKFSFGEQLITDSDEALVLPLSGLQRTQSNHGKYQRLDWHSSVSFSCNLNLVMDIPDVQSTCRASSSNSSSAVLRCHIS